MKILVMSVLALSFVAITGCGRGHAVLNVTDASISDELKEDGVEKAISRVLKRRGWRVGKKSKGKIIANLAVRSHRATIEITYNKDTYSINYVDSQNLKYNEAKGTIHRSYNKWVNNLDRDLQRYTN